MADIFDQATEAEEFDRARALAKQAAKAPAPAGDWNALSAKWCEGKGCGERIPDARRRAVPGVRFCVQCQSANELRARRTEA